VSEVSWTDQLAMMTGLLAIQDWACIQERNCSTSLWRAAAFISPL